jgi:hypothetical protein
MLQHRLEIAPVERLVDLMDRSEVLVGHRLAVCRAFEPYTAAKVG